MSPAEQVDKILDELALLNYGVPFANLDVFKRDEMICQAVKQFVPSMVDLADSMEDGQ